MRPQKLRFDFLIAIFGRPIRWDRSRGRVIAIFKDSGSPPTPPTGGYPPAIHAIFYHKASISSHLDNGTM